MIEEATAQDVLKEQEIYNRNVPKVPFVDSDLIESTVLIGDDNT